MSEQALLVFVGLALFLGGGFAVYLLVRHWRIIRDPGRFELQARDPVRTRSEEPVSTRPRPRLILSPRDALRSAPLGATVPALEEGPVLIHDRDFFVE